MTNDLRKAVLAETRKIMTTLVTWGIGVLVMAAYCWFLYWLKQSFNLYVMTSGAIIFLTFSFFFIDLWWRLSHRKNIDDKV